MTEIIVKTQAELDAALARDDIDDDTHKIIIDSQAGVWITIDDDHGQDVRASGSATVWASGSATVWASGSATVWASDSATVEALDSATVEALGSATVRALDSATVRACGSATVRAWGSATVEASDSATVRALDSATVLACGSATVRACDSATVLACGSATVWACDSATVEASDSATVRACDSATVQASGSATVEAAPYVAVHLFSARATVTGGVVIDIASLNQNDPRTWCELHGVTIDDDGNAHLYKAVDDNLTAGHSWTPTTYTLGSDPRCNEWLDSNACGFGLHICPTAWQARDHYSDATRYLEVTAPLASLRPIDATKCKAPTVHVLREVDLNMRPVKENADD